MLRAFLFCIVLMLVPLLPLRASASPSDRGICDAAGAAAAAQTGVPHDVLRAITRTETGRARDGQLQPWPWTVNMEGKGTWFDNREEALRYVLAHHQRGARSYDVGCFQINYRWHGDAFPSIEAMFDPATNALYAAQFLLRLYAETGSWAKSAAAYHSRTPKFANRYQARFERILARLGGKTLPPPTALAEPGRIPQGIDPLALNMPVVVSGPLTISPPAGGSRGSLAVIDALPGAQQLLRQPSRPLF